MRKVMYSKMLKHKLEPTYTFELESEKIYVFDDLFSKMEISSLYASLCKLDYSLNEIDNAANPDNKHWKREFSTKDAVRKIQVFEDVAQLLKYKYSDRSFELFRIYANVSLYGEHCFKHRDCKLGEGVTGLYYPHEKWDTEWGGETLFYRDNGDTVFALAPRPGRVVFFPGHLYHAAGVPAKTFLGPRMSIAFKFMDKDYKKK